MSQNLYCDHLVTFHQLRIENKEVLNFHVRVEQCELCQNPHQPGTNFTSVSFLCLSLLRHLGIFIHSEHLLFQS